MLRLDNDTVEDHDNRSQAPTVCPFVAHSFVKSLVDAEVV